ncbi:hypothetical protein ONS95_008761 [Cadophora gregata]|uniref:uncharacterized protein n=1 Tax=Cadophora gregata TaxID=51156 RepID=UPI0026DBA0C0|nr:uncharacterized protein ONS95_008761 [Cadophora gregata]KAK0123754.1 hypothetical protein ONS95_008761 [Cadophora gregata]
MDGSQENKEPYQSRKTRISAPLKQETSRIPRNSTSLDDPPSSAFNLDGSLRKRGGSFSAEVNFTSREADYSQRGYPESMSLGPAPSDSHNRPDPPQSQMGAPRSGFILFCPQAGQHGLQPLHYAGQLLSPPQLGNPSPDPLPPTRTYLKCLLSEESFDDFQEYQYIGQNDENMCFSFPTDQCPRQIFSNPVGAPANVQYSHLPSPDPAHTQQSFLNPDNFGSGFDKAGDYNSLDTPLPYNSQANQNQASNVSQGSLSSNVSAGVLPVQLHPPNSQPVYARNPTPPPGYMVFGSPEDLQAAVNNNPLGVHDYIRRLVKDNRNLLDKYGRSIQQTKDEEDRGRRHIATIERAWNKLNAALVQANPALASSFGAAIRSSSGVQTQAYGLGHVADTRTSSNTVGENLTGQGNGSWRDRGGDRARWDGRGNVTGQERAAGGSQEAAPEHSTGRNTRSAKEVSKTPAEDESDIENADKGDYDGNNGFA